MNNEQHTREWQSTRMIPRKPRRKISDSRRRQEEDTDDQPMMPVRSSAVVEMEDDIVPVTDLYPTRSNLHRNGVAVGQPLNNNATNNYSTNDDGRTSSRYRSSPIHHLERTDGPSGYEVQQQTYHRHLPSPPQVRRSHVARIPFDANIIALPILDDSSNYNNNSGSAVATINNRRPRQRPHTITVPQRGVRRCLSAVTMSSDLFSFDGSEFEAIPAADDYMDDDQLQEYLDQLAKEEDRKNRERESLKKELFSASAANTPNHREDERESLRQLLQQLDCGGADGASNNGDYEAYLDRLMEEQMQAEEQCKNNVARRVSDISL